MAILDLKLNKFSSISGTIDKTVRKIEKRMDDYSGIAGKVSQISSSTGNLRDCNVYIKKKNSQLQKKIDKLEKFKKKVSKLGENAKTADRKVAEHIEEDSSKFYKSVGIKTGWRAGIEKIKRNIKKTWKAVKEFYEKHKYLIDLIVDAALLVVAVVALIAAIPTGGATLFFAAFAFASAFADMFTSSVAFGCHLGGNDELAGIWAKRGLKDGFKLVGAGLDKLFGTDFFEDAFAFLHDAVAVASVIYSLGKGVKDIVKHYKNGNFRRVKIETVDTIFGFNLTPGSSAKGYAKIANFFNLKNGKEAYNLVRICSYFKNTKTVIKTIDSIYEGTFFSEISIVDDIKKIYTAGEDFTRNKPAQKIVISSFFGPWGSLIAPAI